MFDIGWSELLVVAVVAIVVVGPKDLPHMLRTFGRWVGKVKAVAADFQRQFNEAVRHAELDDVRKEMEGLTNIDPLADVKKEMDEIATLDPLAGTDTSLGPAGGSSPMSNPPPSPDAEAYGAGSPVVAASAGTAAVAERPPMPVSGPRNPLLYTPPRPLPAAPIPAPAPMAEAPPPPNPLLHTTRPPPAMPAPEASTAATEAKA